MHTQPQQQRSVIASPIATEFSDLPLRPGYFTVAQFAKRNRAFTEPAIRNLVFKADARESTRGTIPGNGLIEAGAIVRIGRKVLLNEGRFFAWVESQGSARRLEVPVADRAHESILAAARGTTRNRGVLHRGVSEKAQRITTASKASPNRKRGRGHRRQFRAA